MKCTISKNAKHTKNTIPLKCKAFIELQIVVALIEPRQQGGAWSIRKRL